MMDQMMGGMWLMMLMWAVIIALLVALILWLMNRGRRRYSRQSERNDNA